MKSRRTLLRWIVRCAALAGVLAAFPARAQPRAPETVSLRYSAPEGCPSADAFRELVRRRGSHTVLEDEGARVIAVEIETSPAPARASIVLPGNDGGADTRTIEGPTCASVTDAAALLVALYLDAEVAARPPPSRDVPAVPAAPAAEPSTELRRVPVRPPAWRASAELGTHVVLASGLAPTASVGEWLFLGVVVASERPSLRPLSLSLRLGVSSMRSGRFDRSSHAQLHAARLALCPLVIPLSIVDVRPCGLGDVGSYSISATSLTRAGEADRPWRSWGLGARTEWKTPLSDAVRIELELDVIAPVVRDRFFRGTTVIHTTPRAVVSGAIGLSVRWP